jgi:uncharacterized protein YndB with AHSA1/START domain
VTSRIEQFIDIGAAPERVWKALVGEGMVEEWLGCLNYRAEIGHVFHMQPDPVRRAAGNIEGATHCELLRLEAPAEMAFSWYFPGTPKTIVTIALQAQEGATRAALVHSGWDQFDEAQIEAIRDGLEQGWRSAVLPQLKAVAERRGR